MDTLLTPNQVAKMFGKSRHWVDAQLRDRENPMPHVIIKHGGADAYRVWANDVKAWSYEKFGGAR